jgi:hypothetical protein
MISCESVESDKRLVLGGRPRGVADLRRRFLVKAFLSSSRFKGRGDAMTMDPKASVRWRVLAPSELSAAEESA